MEIRVPEDAEYDYEPGPHGVKWNARVTDPHGDVVYDGPTPVPAELITITPEMAVAGELFTFDMTPVSVPGAWS